DWTSCRTFPLSFAINPSHCPAWDWSIAVPRSVCCPIRWGVQLGFDWDAQRTPITLAGTLAQVDARGIVVEATVGQLLPVRLALAWAHSDRVPFLLGQFNFFQVFDACFCRARGVFEIRQSAPSGSP